MLREVPLAAARATGFLAPRGPAQPRLDACWNGEWPGTFYASDDAVILVDPTATITWSGAPSVADVQFVVHATLERCGEAMIGLHPGDERAALAVPATNSYIGEVLDYFGRRAASAPPAEQRIVNLDEVGWEGTHHVEWWRQLRDHGAVKPIGLAAMDGDSIVAEAVAMPCARFAELGVWVRPERRHEGLGTRIAAHVVAAVELAGLLPYWNCNGANTGSIRIAERVGFTDPVAYTLWAWP